MRWIFVVAVWFWAGWALFRITPALGMLYAAVFALLGLAILPATIRDLYRQLAGR